MLRGKEALENLAAQWAYVAVCAAAATLGWRAGLKRFAAYGG
jgi:ABC-2 type transport system permease protein